jgi:hypothetical protein
MAYPARGHCWKTGAAGWKIEGDFNEMIACGDWVVVREVNQQHRRLVAYALTSGKPAFRIDSPVLPAFTCAAPGVLLVGERRLSMFKLPHQRPIWTAKPNRGPIIALAVTEHAVAFTDGGPGIAVIPRPTASELQATP